MGCFTDTANNTWEVAVTIGAVKRVKSIVTTTLAIDGIDQDVEVDLLTTNKKISLALKQKLEEDILFFAEVLYAVVKPQRHLKKRLQKCKRR